MSPSNIYNKYLNTCTFLSSFVFSNPFAVFFQARQFLAVFCSFFTFFLTAFDHLWQPLARVRNFCGFPFLNCFTIGIIHNQDNEQ